MRGRRASRISFTCSSTLLNGSTWTFASSIAFSIRCGGWGVPVCGLIAFAAMYCTICLRESSELLPLDDQADLDRAGVELLALGGLLEALQAEDHRIILGHVLFVLLLEELHDRLAALPDAPGLVRDEGAARVRLEEMGSEVVHAGDEERRPEGTHAAVLRIVLFVIANPLDEQVDADLLAVRALVDRCD